MLFDPRHRSSTYEYKRIKFKMEDTKRICILKVVPFLSTMNRLWIPYYSVFNHSVVGLLRETLPFIEGSTLQFSMCDIIR